MEEREESVHILAVIHYQRCDSPFIGFSAMPVNSDRTNNYKYYPKKSEGDSNYSYNAKISNLLLDLKAANYSKRTVKLTFVQDECEESYTTITVFNRKYKIHRGSQVIEQEKT